MKIEHKVVEKETYLHIFIAILSFSILLLAFLFIVTYPSMVKFKEADWFGIFIMIFVYSLIITREDNQNIFQPHKYTEIEHKTK